MKRKLSHSLKKKEKVINIRRYYVVRLLKVLGLIQRKKKALQEEKVCMLLFGMSNNSLVRHLERSVEEKKMIMKWERHKILSFLERKKVIPTNKYQGGD